MSTTIPMMPFRYEPSGDSDGFYAGIDHFVLDSDGDEMACAPNRQIGLLFGAAPELLATCRLLHNALLDSNSGLRHGFEDTLDQAEAVIAKAEGLSTKEALG